jgi:hypothetical protein
MHGLGVNYTKLDQILLTDKDQGLTDDQRPRLTLRDEDERDFLSWLMLEGVNSDKDVEAHAREIFRRHNSKIHFSHQTDERPLASMTSAFGALEEGLEILASEILEEFSDRFSNTADVLCAVGKFLKSRIFIIRVSAPTELDAIRDFEKMNNRGKGLSSLDILRAKVLGAGWHGGNRDKIEEAFQRISHLLPGSERLRTAFVRAVVIAGAPWSCCELVTEHEALARIDQEELSGSRPISKDPLGYTQIIEDCAKHYHRCLQARGVDDHQLDPLMCLEDLNIHRIMMPILMAGREMPSHVYDKFVRVLENIGFVFLMSGRQQKGLETWLCEQVADVRKIRTLEGLQDFVDTRVAKFMEDHEEGFRTTLQTFRLGSASGKRRIRYFLARIAHHVDPSGITLRDLSIRNSKKDGYQIEHIHPESKKAQLGVDDDWRIHWIGNLTLLEEYENNQARDKIFADKGPHYTKSAIAITKSLSEEWKGDCRYARAQRSHSIPKAPPAWDTGEMQKRYDFYCRIASDLWGLKGWAVAS